MLSIQDFEHIYHSFFSQLMRVAYQVTFDMEASEDLCQEAFIRLYHRLDQFPTCQDAQYWLIRVVKNLSINFYTKRKNEQKAVEKIKKAPSKKIKTGEELLLEKEMSVAVREALEKLPPKLKEVLILKEYSDMSYKEIAKAVNISVGNVKIRAFRARALLCELLKKEELGDLS